MSAILSDSCSVSFIVTVLTYLRTLQFTIGLCIDLQVISLTVCSIRCPGYYKFLYDVEGEGHVVFSSFADFDATPALALK